jgi:hypothetical protein
MKDQKKKRDYKKEEARVREKYLRKAFKIDKKYSHLIDQIQENELKGLSGFLVESIKNYETGFFKLTLSEGANLIAVLENFLERNKDYQDKKYLEEIKALRDKIDKYVDDN